MCIILTEGQFFLDQITKQTCVFKQESEWHQLCLSLLILPGLYSMCFLCLACFRCSVIFQRRCRGARWRTQFSGPLIGAANEQPRRNSAVAEQESQRASKKLFIYFFFRKMITVYSLRDSWPRITLVTITGSTSFTSEGKTEITGFKWKYWREIEMITC